jgi:hypothetical protein
MVVACIALAIALSGVSYAAKSLAKNSVGTAQLKNNAVTGAKIADGAVTGADVGEATLDGSQISGVDAATLGGHASSYYAPATSVGGGGSYVASGASWIDRSGSDRDHLEVSYTVGSAGTKTQTCTLPGASSVSTDAAAYQDVHLPNGANVTRMTVDYGDDAASTSSNGTVTLTRQPLFGSGTSATEADVFSVTLNSIGTGLGLIALDDTPGEADPTLGVVDNTQFSYTLMAFPGTLTGVAFCAVRIEYDMP